MKDLIKELRKLHPNEKDEILASVAVDLSYVPENELKAVLASDNIINKLMDRYKNRPQRVKANDPASCPICKRHLTPIKLSEAKRAVWCQSHFVVYPVKD